MAVEIYIGKTSGQERAVLYLIAGMTGLGLSNVDLQFVYDFFWPNICQNNCQRLHYAVHSIRNFLTC